MLNKNWNELSAFLMELCNVCAMGHQNSNHFNRTSTESSFLYCPRNMDLFVVEEDVTIERKSWPESSMSHVISSNPILEQLTVHKLDINTPFVGEIPEGYFMLCSCCLVVFWIILVLECFCTHCILYKTILHYDIDNNLAENYIIVKI